MRGFIEFLVEEYLFIVKGLLIIVVVLSILIVPSVLLDYKSCQRYESMSIPVDWDFWGGCMANHPEFGWLPVKQYFQTMNLNIGE